MRTSEFDFDLPENRIAKYPVEPRDHCRLLLSQRNSSVFEEGKFFDLKSQLKSSDVLVLNDTKVIPARLFATQRERRFEIMLIEQLDSHRWHFLAKPGKKLKIEEPVRFDDGTEMSITREDGEFTLLFPFREEETFRWLEKNGEPPIPPYLKRPAESLDRSQYQTVYADQFGSVAAPTAGLHFTPELLADLESMGVSVVKITLEVGYGTFSPIRSETLDDHEMHGERYTISEDAFRTLEGARAQGGRIIAVGTTAMRTLESIPSLGLSGTTHLFIKPGHEFQWVDGLITNFHLPKSSLIVLVSAFLGVEPTKRAYGWALDRGFRFYSYGDAMLIT